ncbi:MAG: hypothetical protein ACKVP4_04835 [Hyphomicrobium sp.]
MPKTVNFTVGLALLVMLSPVRGEPPMKPAGVRTAIEAIAKKPSLRTVACANIASA